MYMYFKSIINAVNMTLIKYEMRFLIVQIITRSDTLRTFISDHKFKYACDTVTRVPR